MSYGLLMTGDADADLRELETWLQEETLDEVERVLHEPNILTPRAGDVAVHDFVRIRGSTRHYVFLTVDLDRRRNVVEILGIAQFSCQVDSEMSES